MKTAILGLGIIGGTWAKNLEADGIEIKTWNRTAKPEFPGFHTCAREAVEGTEAVIIVVADPPAVQSVLDAICPSLKPGQIVIQSSTISPSWTKKFAAQVEATGAAFLEAPFTGSKPAAEQRQTVYYLGGAPEVVESARPLLERLSAKIYHIGAIGTASALKLAMNLNIAGIAQALSEAITFTRQAGISDDLFFEVLHRNVSHSGLADLKEPKLRTHNYSPQFSVKHMGKDLRLAVETAGSLDLPQTKNLLKIYEDGKTRGWSDDDFIGLIRLLEK